jgi:hypothetical protein
MACSAKIVKGVPFRCTIANSDLGKQLKAIKCTAPTAPSI